MCPWFCILICPWFFSFLNCKKTKNLEKQYKTYKLILIVKWNKKICKPHTWLVKKRVNYVGIVNESLELWKKQLRKTK